MGANFHTPYTSSTLWKPEYVNPPLSDLDRGTTYLKNVIVHSDGPVTYSPLTGILAWASTLRIIFNRADGKAIQNTVAVGSITLNDNEFAYLDLNETDGAVLTASKAAVTTGAASNFLAYNRIVLAYRNSASDELFCVYLPSLTSNGSIPYDVGGNFGGKPTASQVILRLPMVRSVTFPTDLTGSRGVAGVAATAQTDFDLKRGGSSFGTMRFAVSGTVASFISASGASFAAGDVLTVVAPGSPDATLEHIGFLLAGTR